MNFNPNPSKQAQEIIFSRKLHNPVYFNHISVFSVQQVPPQRHLGIYLDTKLNFREHLNNLLNKVNKTIGQLRKPQAFLPLESLGTVY